MPGVFQGVVLFLVGCVVVYGLLASIKSSAGGHEKGGHGHGHGHH